MISPFGKPKRSVLLSGVRCAGNESRLIDCPANKLSFEIGKTLLSHVNVAGVVCRLPLTTSKVMACPTPTQLPPPVCPSMECACPTYTPLSTPCPTTSSLTQTVISTITEYSISCPIPTLTSAIECPTTQCLQESLPTVHPQSTSNPLFPRHPSGTIPIQRAFSTQSASSIIPSLQRGFSTHSPKGTSSTIPPQHASSTLPHQGASSPIPPQHASSPIHPNHITNALLNSQQTVLAVKNAGCVSYLHTLIAVCVVFASVTAILGVG